MKFIFMGFERRGEWPQLSQAEQQRRIRKHQDALVRIFAQRSAAGRGHLTFSVGLHDTEESQTVRLKGGKHSVTDGPFAESKEVLAGFDVIDFDSREQAVEWYRSIDFDHKTHIQEIRPVRDMAFIYHGHRPALASKFLLQFGSAPASQSEAESERIFRTAGDVTAEYVRKGFMDESICYAGARLGPPEQAITLRQSACRVVTTDGPFAEGREVIGGFSVLQCASRDEAARWAQKYSFVEGDITEVIPCGLWWTHLT